MKRKFDPITGKSGAIIESVMNSDDLPKDEDIQFKIRLCVEEIVENVVNYAYDNGCGYIEVETSTTPDLWTISFKDAGVPFNPLEKPDPDVTLSLNDRPVGGLGIFLCKQMMDSLAYEHKNGCNILTMSKKIR